MEYELVELEDFSGEACTIYSVMLRTKKVTLFEEFVNVNAHEYREEVNNIIARLQEICDLTGARSNFFKLNEGKPGDGVCALFDIPKSKLRLYCIRYGNNLIILGGGGPKTSRSYQEDTKLNDQVAILKLCSADITSRFKNGQISIARDGYSLEGELNNFDDEE